MWDEQEKMRTAEEKGVAKGIEKGKTEEKIEIAKTGKANKIPYETISLMTGLAIEEIEKI